MLKAHTDGYVIDADAPAPGYPLAHRIALARHFARREIRIRYAQSLIGVLWALAQPLSLAAIATLVLHRGLDVPAGTMPFAFDAFTGLVIWTFVQSATLAAVPSLVHQSDLVRKVAFPRATLPLGVVGAFGLDLLIGLVAWIVGIVVVGGTWHVSLLATPLMLMPAIGMTVAVVLVASAVNVYFRDVKHALPLLLQIGFLATPVVYPLSALPDTWARVLRLNPIAVTIDAMRCAAAGQSIPWTALAIATAIAVVCCVLAHRVFLRAATRFADVI